MSQLGNTGSDELIHEHFILDAELVHPLNFDNRHEITRTLIDELMSSLNMVELGTLQVYDAVDPTFPGWSFIQPITTSHISGHYFEEKNKASHIHLDIYSCKYFDWKKVIILINKNLDLAHWVANYVVRANTIQARGVVAIEGKGGSFTVTQSLPNV